MNTFMQLCKLLNDYGYEEAAKRLEYDPSINYKQVIAQWRHWRTTGKYNV